MASSISKRNSKTQHTIIETAPKATLLMLLAGLFILFIEALLIQRLDSPVVFSAPFAYLALYGGAALGGSFCSRIQDERLGFGCALISSSILCVLLILAKAFITAAETPIGTVSSFIAHMLIPFSAVLGALLCNRFKTNKVIKKRKNHYRSTK